MLGSLDREGVDALGAGGMYLQGFEDVAIGGANREMGGGGLGNFAGSLRNMLLLEGNVSGCATVREAVRNASFAIRFSSHKIAASYHSRGSSSEGRPEVKQATWSCILGFSP